MKKAIIIGASSGIGRELAKILSRNQYSVGVMARRVQLLDELGKEAGELTPTPIVLRPNEQRFRGIYHGGLEFAIVYGLNGR
jgi:NADP-dependent 3-hydroxy acid dehydrogenase YdfG